LSPVCWVASRFHRDLSRSATRRAESGTVAAVCDRRTCEGCECEGSCEASDHVCARFGNCRKGVIKRGNPTKNSLTTKNTARPAATQGMEPRITQSGKAATKTGRQKAGISYPSNLPIRNRDGKSCAEMKGFFLSWYKEKLLLWVEVPSFWRLTRGRGTSIVWGIKSAGHAGPCAKAERK
jgi:hypothetical protein